MLPAAGRVIALYPTEDHNVLWVNPVVNEPAGLAATLRSSDWANLGGDRTWISPEVETHIGDPARMAETYAVPKEVDPGQYGNRFSRSTVDPFDGGYDSPVLALEGRCALAIVQDNLASGYATGADDREGGIRGLSTRDFIGGDRRTATAGAIRAYGTWRRFLAAGKSMYRYAALLHQSRLLGSRHGSPKHGLIQIQARAEQPMKPSIHARDSRGMLIHERTNEDRAVLVVRRFAVAPPARYFDAPCDDLNDVGYMAQVYVDDGGLGDFAELEYHSPGLDADAGIHCLSDTSEVLAFVGPPTEIHELHCTQQGFQISGASR